MAKRLVIKHSMVQGKVPTLDDLQWGELALNIPDQVLYTMNDIGEISTLTVNPAQLETKVDKVEGKSLTTNDFTDTLLAKLNAIEEGAQVNVGTELSVTQTDSVVSITTSTGTGTVDIVSATDTTSGVMSATDKSKLDSIEEGAQVNVGTELSVTQISDNVTISSSTGVTVATIAVATDTIAGTMSSSDKVKLDGIEAGAQVNPVTTDSRISTSTSEVLQAKSMSDHIASGDHDDRYYTKSEIDAMFAALNP